MVRPWDVGWLSANRNAKTGPFQLPFLRMEVKMNAPQDVAADAIQALPSGEIDVKKATQSCQKSVLTANSNLCGYHYCICSNVSIPYPS